MRKGVEAIFHIFFWVSTSWLIVSSFSIQSHEIEMLNGVESVKIVRNNGVAYQLLICIFISFIAFYTNFRVIIKKNQIESLSALIWYVLAIFAGASVLVYAVTEIRLLSNSPPIPKQIAFGAVFFYFSVSVAYALAKNSMFYHQRHQQLIIDKKQAELTLLRNQLQPHFLFNALNNLLSMVNRSENPKLVSSIDKLSNLLRFVIDDNKKEKIPISKEIEFLKNYIDLQMLRFEEDEVQVQFKVVGENGNQAIEPGLLIPFVENAFKYGTEPERVSNIDVLFDLSKADLIQFEVKNKIMMPNTSGAGTGINATKKRLEIIYPDQHELRISNGDDFIVRLNIHTR